MSLKGAAPLTQSEIDRFAPIFGQLKRKEITAKDIEANLGPVDYQRFKVFAVVGVKARNDYREASQAADEATHAHDDAKQKLAETQQKFEQLSVQKAGLQAQLTGIQDQRGQLKANVVQYNMEIERSRQAAAAKVASQAQGVKVPSDKRVTVTNS